MEVNKNAEILDIEKAKTIISVAAKILYITKQMRPDIESEVAHFTVANSNVYDWKKMKRCITFLKQSKKDK